MQPKSNMRDFKTVQREWTEAMDSYVMAKIKKPDSKKTQRLKENAVKLTLELSGYKRRTNEN